MITFLFLVNSPERWIIMYFLLIKNWQDCGPKGDCENHKCILICKRSDDCNGGFCSKRRCIPPICKKYKDCGPGNKCISETCIIGCKDKHDCPEGKDCIKDYCSTPPGIRFVTNRHFSCIFLIHNDQD